jgi:lipoprotein NlpI
MVLTRRAMLATIIMVTLSHGLLADTELSVDDKQRALAVAYNNLGVVRALNNDFATADVYFDSALIVGGDLSQVYNNLGNNQMCQGNLEAALVSFETAFALDAFDQRGLFNWSFALYLSGSVDRAVEMMERFLSASEDDRAAAEVLAVWLDDEDIFKGESKIVSKAELKRLLEKAKIKRDKALAKKKLVAKDSKEERIVAETKAPDTKKRRTTPAGEKSTDTGGLASMLYWVFL